MNLARLQDIYRNIDIADRGDMDTIRQLTQDYPFYWMPYVILAKYYFQTGHYKFEDTLRQAAMRVYDRRSLYDYIHGRIKEAETIFEESPAETREVIAPFESNESGIGEIVRMPEVVLQEEPVLEHESAFVAETEDTYSRPGITDFLDEYATEEKPTEFVFEGKHEPMQSDTVEMDQDIIGEEIETEFSFSKSYAPVIPPVEEEEAKNIQFEEPQSQQVVPNIEVAADDEPGRMDFFSWLEHPAPPEESWVKEGGNEEFEDEEKKTVEKEDMEVRSESGEQEESGEKTDAHEIRGMDLIERFIASNPQISRPKKEFFNPENMAKRSEIIDLEYVTETLANLYYEQGNIDLAVKAYEKLSLQNPLKEAYFASLIEKIRKEKK